MNNLRTFRHELKYYINYFEYHLLRSRLKRILNNDQNSNQNNEYFIRSLYFDDYRNSALYEKQAGILNRYKYRIRTYNFSKEVIKLERKSKHGQFISKESTRISFNDYLNIMNQDYSFLKNSDNALLKDFYFHIVADRLKPDVIVDYTREAYVSKLSNIRVTFDKNLRTGLSSTDMFNSNIPTIDVIERPCYILEIKYDKFLPTHIKNVIQINSNTRYAISKFVICKKYNKLNNWEDN